ncbi:replication endonuclease [Pseudoroseomonas wenyumeiae]
MPDLTPTERRLKCPLHWRRQLRKRAKRARQFWSAALQTVGGRTGTPYADDYAHDRWQERQDAAREHGAARVLVGRDGTRLPLLDVMRSSVAATLNRVYVMTVGIEQIAAGMELVPVFVTLTLPGQYHPESKAG